MSQSIDEGGDTDDTSGDNSYDKEEDVATIGMEEIGGLHQCI